MSPSYAQTAKTIALKDGSTLKGKVIKLENNIYTLEIPSLGQIEVPESDIISITPAKAPSGNGDDPQKTELKDQVQKIQGNIMTDPALMLDIQNIVNDEEVRKLLSDPKLMQDVLSYDQEKIQGNKGVQDLMDNPKIQDLMNKIYQKIPSNK